MIAAGQDLPEAFRTLPEGLKKNIKKSAAEIKELGKWIDRKNNAKIGLIKIDDSEVLALTGAPSASQGSQSSQGSQASQRLREASQGSRPARAAKPARAA